jgi:hypothetical protein
MVRPIVAVLVLATSIGAGGCGATAPTSSPSVLTPVAITDLKTVAGKWEGLGQGPWAGSVLGGHTADWVELTINADGTYEARSHREIGVLRTTGTLTLSDNVMHWKSDRSRGVMSLVADQSGARTLRLKGELTSGGGTLSAELKPATKR